MKDFDDKTHPIDVMDADSTAQGSALETLAREDREREEATSRPIPEDALIIVPVRNVVLFPGMVLPLTLARERSRAAAHEAVRLQRPLGILLQGRAEVEEPQPSDMHWIGTMATVLRYITAPDGGHHAICQGVKRFRVLQYLEGFPFMVARVEIMAESDTTDPDIEGRALNLKQRAAEILQLLPQVPEEVLGALQGVEGPARLADFIAGLMDISAEEKQALLETFDLRARLDKLLELLTHRIEVLKVSREISERTKGSIDEGNRKHVLREQMRQIQKELGEDDEGAAEIAELSKAVADAHMPEEVEKVARKELKRLERMPEGAGEYSMTRTYLDWLIELPWSNSGIAGDKAIDIAEARKILDEDHYGLDKVKKRILEYLAVKKLNPSGRSPILCFSGPPGVGKTSLGQSIAKATGRKFHRLALGGVHDESEIRGHRRTYVGALPGNIIQGIRRVGTRHCVMMLDEIDKLGAGGFHGDPASALLEVLDPEQNSTFRDTYLSVPYDLSNVMFVCTANVLDTIPGPLRDRMEIIQLPGYTGQEKLQIARRYLVSRQLEATGLKPEQAAITDDSLQAIIDDYTREAGVRNLEREIGKVFRNVAVRIAEGEGAVADGGNELTTITIEPKDLPPIIGARKYEAEVAMRTGIAGVATGLAWTPVGGDILFIEATRMPGSGRLILTGQLGDVMKESAQAALSLVKGQTKALDIPPETLKRADIHVHVPAGATPKDGPSAGVAMYVALVSLLTNRPVKSDVAMTGEISLRGLVLPIGGVKEKVLAALRAGIRTVLLPSRNRRDLDDIPAEARDKLDIVFVERVEEAIEAALSAKVDTPAESKGVEASII